MYYKKICNIAISIASIFVFIIWSIINNIDFSKYGIHGFSVVIISFFISLVSAYAFFNISTSIIAKFLLKITLIRRLLFGSAYIGGVWIGYYKTPDRDYLCYVTIEQNIDKPTVINGFSFNVKKELRNIWTSDGEASINKNNLRFQYNVTSIDDNANYDGFVRYILHEKKRFSNPHLITGSAYNLETDMKIHTELKKYNHKLLNHDRETLITKALDFYNAEAANPDSIKTNKNPESFNNGKASHGNQFSKIEGKFELECRVKPKKGKN